MKVTAQTIEKILRAMTAKKMKQKELADKIGVHRTYISKLLAGEFPSIPDEQANKISDALEVVLLPLVFQEGKVSTTALALTEYANEDPAFSSVLETLLALKGGDAKRAFLPSLDPKDVRKVGKEAIRLAFLWEDGDESRATKVGADLLTFIRELYRAVEATEARKRLKK